MTSEMAVGAHWGMLGRPAPGKLESYAVKSVAHRSLRLALDSDGSRHLLVPTTGKPVDLPVEGAAVRFTLRPLAFGDDTGVFLEVICTDPMVYREFDLLVEDVVERITSLDSAAVEALDAIERWRRFLALQGRRRLTFLEQMGLMAELSVLDAALAVHLNSSEAWVGPFKSKHDFEFEDGCVEVKAIGADLDSVEIHGLHQLSPHDERSLHLVLVEVIATPDGRDVLTYAAEISSRYDVDLAQPLAALGLDLDESDEHLITFATGTTRIAPVTPGVPRLVPTVQTAEQDIAAVRYRIRIAALLPHVSSENLATLLSEVVVAG